jgi:hypothetical protein
MYKRRPSTLTKCSKLIITRSLASLVLATTLVSNSLHLFDLSFWDVISTRLPMCVVNVMEYLLFHNDLKLIPNNITSEGFCFIQISNMCLNSCHAQYQERVDTYLNATMNAFLGQTTRLAGTDFDILIGLK